MPGSQTSPLGDVQKILFEGKITSPLGDVPKIFFQVKIPWSCTSPLEKGLEIMPNLKSIDLSNCDSLTKVSDFSRFPNLVDLILTGCENLVELDHSVGFLKNLVNLDLRFCKNLRKFEINNEMKSLKRLELRDTAIKALPSSSIGYLTNLEALSSKRCRQLTNVPCSILKLQHLQNLSLGQCEKLVTFPTGSAFSTNSSTTSLHDPLYVDLFNCHNLVEISEFPREIDGLSVSRCYRLQKISKLSDILEGEDSKMIPWMDLSYCVRLCSILAYGYKKENYVPDYSEVTALLSLFLSCRQSEFEVVFPALSGVPNWFSCSREIEWPDKVGFKVCNFIIEFPPNFKWENKGLAFCIRSDRRYSSCAIYINDVGILEEPKFPKSRSWVFCDRGFDKHMWLYYVPFDTIIRRLSEGGFQPTFIFQVDFHLEYKTLPGDRVGSIGVHVVMPEDEGIFVNGVFHQIEVHQQKPSNLEAHQQKPSNLRRRKGWEAPGY